LSNCPDFKSIRKLYAHPQGIAQCRNWIQANLPQAEVIEASSNARAAAIVAWEKYGAAIAGRIAASEYELSVLAEHIEDFSGNTTRFFVIGNDDCRPTGSDKTSLVCSVKDRPGALSDLLGAFSKRSINMTRIESRPTRKKAWEYLFFIDVDGHHENAAIREAIAELDHSTQFQKILGSYPVGRFYET
jgi:chorismate mutase/prephenate dehydratase